MDKVEKTEPDYVCDKCNLPLHTIQEVGYLGNPHSDSCSEFTELMTLCVDCTPFSKLIKSST
jgi:hypothetical protein